MISPQQDSDYNTHIGKVNPYRYRGYYYDRENGLYYLQNRYYDPVTRRFISADSPAAAIGVQSGAFGGLNPYSYCLNDPVNHTDPLGRWVVWIMYALIGLMLGLAVDQFIRSVQTFIREPSWLNLGMAVMGLANVVISVFSAVSMVHAVNAVAQSNNLLKVYDNAQAHFAKMPKGTRGLDWGNTSKGGQTAFDHIYKHSLPNYQRANHGVFKGNPIEMVNTAWSNKTTAFSISDGMGGTIYNIPHYNAGYQSGYVNFGQQMDYITIIVKEGTSTVWSAFPSFGGYGIKYLYL